MLRDLHGQLVVIGTALCVCACVLAQEPDAARVPETQPAGPPPRLELSPEEFDLGELWQGMPAEQKFTVRNVGEGPLTVDVRSGCGCTVATKPKSPLAPGESDTFLVSYNTHFENYTGDVKKRVRVVTNDPDRPDVAVPIRGKIKKLFEATPSSRISLQGLTPDSRESAQVKLVSQYPGPVKLKLKAGQDLSAFDVELKETLNGAEYELTVTTKPPLKIGFTRMYIELETGLEDNPIYKIQALANAQPRVLVMPEKVYVTSARKEAHQQVLRVQFCVDTPLTITGVESDLESVQFQVVPAAPAKRGIKRAVHQVHVTLPGYADVPDVGGKLVVLTDDESPEFKRIEVPVIKRESLARRATGVRPPGGAVPIQPRVIERSRPEPDEGADDDEAAGEEAGGDE